MSEIGGNATDKGMMRVMGMVGVALLLLAICIGLTANILGDTDDGLEGDALMRNALVQRIEPVAGVRTSADDLPVAAADAGLVVADAGPMKTGEELVNGACASCHVAGVAGAPLLGDEAAWAERREQGLDYLVASVINGKNAMPARGGSTYTDDEIKRAVQYIALFEDVDEPSADAADDTAAPAADTVVGDAASAADAVNPQNDMTAESMVNDGNDMAADDRIDEALPGDDAEPEAAENADAALIDTVTDDKPLVEAAALVVGQAPDNLPDHVKTTVDGVCAGCHIAGVANAPKIGDAAAWQERADLGLAALTDSVINGKGVMPARGGSNLTDAEIPIAIQYLMSK